MKDELYEGATVEFLLEGFDVSFGTKYDVYCDDKGYHFVVDDVNDENHVALLELPYKIVDKTSKGDWVFLDGGEVNFDVTQKVQTMTYHQSMQEAEKMLPVDFGLIDPWDYVAIRCVDYKEEEISVCDLVKLDMITDVKFNVVKVNDEIVEISWKKS